MVDVFRNARSMACLLSVVPMVACSSDPDVVVEGELAQPEPSVDASAFLEVDLVEGCAPGTYRGTFEGGYASLFMAPEPFVGSIEFTLEESLSGEFLTVENSSIEGDLAGGIPFTADVVSDAGGCTAGFFQARLENGKFDVAGYEFTFEGPVNGQYFPDETMFFGDWQTEELQTGTLIGDGTWFARRLPD